LNCAGVRGGLEREDEQLCDSLWKRSNFFVMSATQPNPWDRHMPEMNLSEAAKWAGVTRPTIHKALTSGRLSGRKEDNGQWKIALSELDRIYVRSKTANMSGNTSLAELMAAKDREIALHRQLAEQAEATAADLRKERDRLLGIVEAAGRLLAQQASKARETPASSVLVTTPSAGVTREKREPLVEAIERIQAIPPDEVAALAAPFHAPAKRSAPVASVMPPAAIWKPAAASTLAQPNRSGWLPWRRGS
jgi:hypothetical protein